MIQIEREKLEKVLAAFYSMKETLAENDEPTTFNEDEAITIIKDVLAQPDQFRDATKMMAQKDSEPVADEEISMPPYLCASYEGDDLYTGDQVRQLIKLVVDKKLQQKPMAWNGDCVLGHCNSPAGCEASNCCRADYTKDAL